MLCFGKSGRGIREVLPYLYYQSSKGAWWSLSPSLSLGL